MKIVKSVTLELGAGQPLTEVLSALGEIADDVQNTDPTVGITDDLGIVVSWEVQY